MSYKKIQNYFNVEGIQSQITAVSSSVDSLDASSLTQTTAEMFLYCDALNGDDNNTGLSWSQAKKTFAATHDLVPYLIKHNIAINLTGSFTESVYFNTRYIESNKKVVIDGGTGKYIKDDNGGSNYTISDSATSQLTASGAGWTPNEFVGLWVEFQTGPLSGSSYSIQKNTNEVIYPTKMFASDPTAASEFRIVKPGTGVYGTTTYNVGAQDVNGAGIFSLQNFSISSTKATAQIKNCTAQVWLTHFVYDSPTIQTYRGVSWSTCPGIQLTYFYINPSTFATSYASPLCVGIHNGFAKHGISSQATCYGLNSNGTFWSDGPNIQIYNGSSFKSVVIRTNLGVSSLNETGFLKNIAGWNPTRVDGSAGVGILIDGVKAKISDDVIVENTTTHGIEVRNGGYLQLGEILAGSGISNFGLYAHGNSTVIAAAGASKPLISGSDGEISVDGSTFTGSWVAVDAGSKIIDSEEFTIIKKE